jgi:hypothetical protein
MACRDLYVAMKLLYDSRLHSWSSHGESFSTVERRRAMTTVWTSVVVVAAVVGSFLLAAPVIESATSGYTQFFQAVGTADSGAD